MKYRLFEERQLNFVYVLALVFICLITLRAGAQVDNFQPVIISTNETGGFENATITVCTTNTSMCADTWNQTFLSTSTRSSAVVYLQGGGGLNTTYNTTYWMNVWLDANIHTSGPNVLKRNSIHT